MGALEPHPALKAILPQGSLANVNRSVLMCEIPTRNDYVDHPDFDASRQRQTLIPHPRDVKASDFQAALIRVYCSLGQASHVTIPVVGGRGT